MAEYENADMRQARSIGLCGALMANSARLRSGQCCNRLAGHAGDHASQHSRRGQADRVLAARAAEREH